MEIERELVHVIFGSRQTFNFMGRSSQRRGSSLQSAFSLQAFSFLNAVLAGKHISWSTAEKVNLVAAGKRALSEKQSKRCRTKHSLDITLIKVLNRAQPQSFSL